MNIGIVGAGNMGVAMGRIWARGGHGVLFSFSKNAASLQAAADAAGPNARTGTPAQAAAFGDVVLLAVPWGAVDDALRAAGKLQDKVLLSCVNALKPDLSGLAVG